MKKLLFLAIILLQISFLSAQEIVSETIQSDIPSVEIKDIEGNVFNTSDIKNDGSPIIIDFWATWCKPCIKELMAIDENYADWQEETNVKVYAVSVDDSRSMHKVAPFVNGKGWEFEILIDPNGDFQRAMGVVNVPHTFVDDVSMRDTIRRIEKAMRNVKFTQATKNGKRVKARFEYRFYF